MLDDFFEFTKCKLTQSRKTLKIISYLLSLRSVTLFLPALCMNGTVYQGLLSKPTEWEQGWRSGESTRLPPMWPGSRCHMWVEFVVGSRPCSEGFSPGFPVFLPPQKPTFPISNSTWKQWRGEPLRGFH